MSTLNITAEELGQLVKMKDQGKISEAWNFLGSKGDAYAYLAGAIVADNTASMSPLARLFYEMVRSQWNNTGAGGPDGAWGGTVFKGVGQRHLENYLKLLNDKPTNGGYTLPNTIQIETSYREALTKWGLPPITAIDSLFSVVDLALGNGNRQLPQDFSWAQFMDISNGLMGGPRWQSDRIEFNSEVFKNDVTPVDAVVTFGRTLVNSLERFGAGAVATISPFAPAYWAFKAVDGALDYTMVDFARRNAAHVAFRAMDAALSPETMDALLDAADNDDRRGFGTALDFLGKALGIPLADSNASRAQIFDNVKALSDWRDKTPQTLGIKLIELSSAGTQAQRADADGLAYRYALANLHPFAVVGADYSARNTKGELDLYNPVAGTGQITDQWIADRTAMLAHVMYANAQDVAIPSSIPGATGMHYEDVASGKKIDIGLPDNVVEKRQTVFGDGKSNVLTGKKLQDHLYGGSGADTLEGKDGADYLEGGADADTYVLQTGLTGIDTLVDSGANTLQVGGKTVSGAFAQVAGMGGDIYYSADKSYQLRKAENGVWRLAAKNEGTGQYSAVADLKNWKDGDYGLTIGAPTQEPERIAPVVYPNSVAYLAMDGAAAPKGVTFGGGTKSDSFNGSSFDDVITTGGGLSNYVMAFGGDDMVVGGDGRDFIRTGQNASSPTLKDNDIGFGGARQGILDGRNISPARQAAMPYRLRFCSPRVLSTPPYWYQRRSRHAAQFSTENTFHRRHHLCSGYEIGIENITENPEKLDANNIFKA